MGDKLLDFRRHAKEVPQYRGQTFAIAHVPNERSDVKELGDIGDRVAPSKRRRRQADESADIRGKAILVRTISTDMRLRLRPGAIKKREEAVMEEIQKPAERGVAGIAQAFARILGDVKRQRTIRTEQAEQPHLQACGAAARPRVKRCYRRRRERQIRILSEPDWLINGTQSTTPARLVEGQALQPAQRLIEIVLIWLLRQGGEEAYSVGLAPHCGTHLLISPRLSERRTVSVNELIDA